MSQRMQLTKANSTKEQRRAFAQAALQKRRAPPPARVPRKKNKRAPRNRESRKPNHYAICRLNPFSSKGSMGIPDGSQTKKIVCDHRLTVNIGFGSTGTVGIMFTPALPSFVWVYPFDTTTVLNGTTITQFPNSGVLAPVCCAEWYNMTVNYRNVAGNYNDVQQLFGADKARIVSGAWQLMFVGTTMNDSGIIRVNTAGFTLGDPVTNRATFFVQDYDVSAQALGYNTDQVIVRTANTDVSAALFTLSSSSAETVMQRLNRSAHGLLKHSGKDYEFRPVSHNCTFIGKTSDENAGLLMTNGNVVAPVICGTHALTQFFDDQWDSTFITVTGGTPGQAFVLDTILCVEYVPAASSSVLPLAKAGQPLNQRVLDQVERAAGQQPAASAGVFDTVMAAGKKAVEIGGVVSAVAGLVL